MLPGEWEYQLLERFSYVKLKVVALADEYDASIEQHCLPHVKNWAHIERVEEHLDGDLIAVGNCEELLFLHYQGFAEELNVILRIEAWTRDSFKESDVGQEVCKCNPLFLKSRIFDKVFVGKILRTTDRLEELNQNFSEDVMVFYLSTDHECKRHEVRVGAIRQIVILDTC